MEVNTEENGGTILHTKQTLKTRKTTRHGRNVANPKNQLSGLFKENTALYQYFIRPVSSYGTKSLNHQVDLDTNQASCLNQACKIVDCVARNYLKPY